MSYNKLILIGRLTADPELKYTPGGASVTKFTLAVARPFKNAQGEKEVDFIDCVAWKGLAETVANHVKKGYMIVVDGRLQIRSYEDKDRNRRKAVEVVCEQVRFLDRGKDSGQGQGGPQGQRGQDGMTEVPFTEDEFGF